MKVSLSLDNALYPPTSLWPTETLLIRLGDDMIAMGEVASFYTVATNRLTEGKPLTHRSHFKVIFSEQEKC